MRLVARSKALLIPFCLGLMAGPAPLAVADAVQTAGSESSDTPLVATRRWHEPYVTLLDVNFADTGFQARWEYFHCGCGDILVRLEQTAPDGVVTGEILLVAGQALAARGMVSLSEDLEPMLQPPSIMMHLAFTLMEYGMPEGPASVTERRDVRAGSETIDLELNSGMATGTFRAPWKVTGEAWPAGEGQRRFELRFEFANPMPADPDARTVFTFSGGQDYRRDDFPLAGETPLAGWKLQWISKGQGVADDPPEGLTLDDVRTEARTQPEA